MSYTVQQLATLAGVSVRTLHYYDEVGILTPAGVKRNGYRYYEEEELLKLQQILFFREIDLPLLEIKKILAAPSFNIEAALRDHHKLLLLKKERLDKLMQTIDKTIKKINNEITMDDKDLYGNFSKEEMEKYSEEAKQRWGHTDAYKESQVRAKKMGKEGLKKAGEEGGAISIAIGSAMKAGHAPESSETQLLIAKHYDWLRNFYEPNLELYQGLGEMYVADERFKANYEKIAEGLAGYMRDSMLHFVKQHKK